MKLQADLAIYKTSIRVSQSGDRQSFDLLLPKDCVRLEGIAFQVDLPAVLAMFIRSTNWPSGLVGQLSLRWNAPGDIFFQHALQYRLQAEENYAPMKLRDPSMVSVNFPGFWIWGKQFEPIAIEVPGSQREIQGYFRDVIAEQSGINTAYEVSVYLYYRRTR